MKSAGRSSRCCEEVRHAGRQGVSEVTSARPERQRLCRRHGRWRVVDLATLIHHVAAIPGIERIRFTTSHPLEFKDSLIEAYANVPKLANHLHLPVQSGSDRILALMKRGYTALEYKAKIRKLRAVRPDISISSDFIVGFPGESERDFEATLGLVRDVGFDQSFSFIYSRRPGTPAASCPMRSPHESSRSGSRACRRSSTRRHRRSASDGRRRAARAGRAGLQEECARARGPHREQPLGQLCRPRILHQSFRRRVVTEARATACAAGSLRRRQR